MSITGDVRDATTGEPLPAANIRIDGTARGTITNSRGEFGFSLFPGHYRLIISFVGYRSDTISLSLQTDIKKRIALQPIPIQMAEIVVTDEDPGMRIMRKVIENKKRWADGLKTYQLQAFTRQVIRRDTSIASISESYSTGYWQKGDTLREVIQQKRQTENVPIVQNFAAVGGIVNFYNDEIRLSGYRFVGPTALNAFDYYSFRLIETRESAAGTVYTIRMIPLSRVTPLFKGTISVIDQSFAVVAVDVAPNEAFRIPFVKEFDFRYAQGFALYEEQFWMPVDIRITGRAKVSFLVFSIPPIGIEQISSIYDYKINVELPDTVFGKPRRTVAAEAEKFDTLFWAQHEVLPLTKEEQHAYATLDSTQTLQRQFQPTGPATGLGPIDFRLFRYIDFRYNRTEGFFGGGKISLDSLAPWLSVDASVGYGFADRRAKWRLGTEFFFDGKREYGVGLEVYRDVGFLPDENLHPAFVIAMAALMHKEDYRDYYYRSGWTFSLIARPVKKLNLDASIRTEDHASASVTTNYSIFAPNAGFRFNPPIDEGRMRSLTLVALYGDKPIPLGFLSTKYVQLQYEYSSSGFLNSSFDFQRLMLRADYQVNTLLSRHAFPPTLYMRLRAGTSSGVLPVQRAFSLESRYAGHTPFGVLKAADVKEFAGDRFVALSLEHNFRSAPFLALNLPFLYEKSIELFVHGSIARAWSGRAALLSLGGPTDGWYSEAGIGLGRILDLFRIDATYRFMEPRRIAFSLSMSRLF